MSLVKHALVATLLLALVACSGDRHYAARLPSTQLKWSQFRNLRQTVAQGGNTGNARLAVFEFFGGVKGRPKPMSMQWHHIVFDETTHIGMGEYTFMYEIRTHGIVIVRIVAGRIANWREYGTRIASGLGAACRVQSILNQAGKAA
jgi:hypothetical protein